MTADDARQHSPSFRHLDSIGYADRHGQELLDWIRKWHPHWISDAEIALGIATPSAEQPSGLSAALPDTPSATPASPDPRCDYPA
jgi:hypothetical protein